MGIPQYNALEDKACASYFHRKGLPKSIKNVKEVRGEDGMERESGEFMGGKEGRGQERSLRYPC